MHIASSSEEPRRLTTSSDVNSLAVIAHDEILKQVVPLTPGVNEAAWRNLLNRYDAEKKGSLHEHEWRALCLENAAQLGAVAAMGTVVDFGRLSETRLGAPIALRRKRKSVAEIVLEFLEGFIAGGLAGAISKTIIAPGDRVKIIFQVDPNRKFSLRAAVELGARIVREGGILGLWMGNGATMMRVIPYASITFMSFEQYHVLTQRFLMPAASHHSADAASENKSIAVLCRFLSGACAGATATAFTYPLDLMRARFAAHAGGEHLRQYPSYIIAFRTIGRQEGIRSLYSGLLPTLMGIMPYAGSSFACFETLKHYLMTYQGLKSDREIPAWQRLIAGGFSGLVAQSFTYPLDIVRRRMQVHPGRYRGLTHALREIYKHEGIRNGLYKGLAMNWIKGPIAVASSFTVNDIVKSRIREYHKDAEEASYLRNDGRGGTWFAEAALCGAAAGAVGKLWTAPFDRMKIMYQLGQHAADEMTFGRHAANTMSEMYCENPNMWQGSGAMIMRVIPYAAITYACYDHFRPLAERATYSHGPCFISNFMAGAGAATVATALLYPLDLMHTRNAASPVRLFDSYYNGMRDIVRTRGVFSLWEGALSSVIGIGPMAGIGFAVYEDFKERFQCDTFTKRFVAGAAAGAIAQALTYPLNVIRRRAQVESIIYEGFAKRMKNIYIAKGFYSGLYQRMPFGWTMGAMTVGISFSINDLCRDSIARAKREIRESAALPTFSQFATKAKESTSWSA